MAFTYNPITLSPTPILKRCLLPIKGSGPFESSSTICEHSGNSVPPWRSPSSPPALLVLVLSSNVYFKTSIISSSFLCTYARRLNPCVDSFFIVIIFLHNVAPEELMTKETSLRKLGILSFGTTSTSWLLMDPQLLLCDSFTFRQPLLLAPQVSLPPLALDRTRANLVPLLSS